MFCPACGAENAESNRFCVSCGSTLSARPAEDRDAPTSLSARFGRLLGTTKKARLISLGTVVALVVAIVAFLALQPSDEAGESAYLRSLDRSCVTEKERVVSLEQETLQRGGANIAAFATVLVTIVAEWHAGLEASSAPPRYAEGVTALDGALRDVLIEAGGLARVVRTEAGGGAVGRQAGAVDSAAGEVDRAIEDLGLEDCAGLSVALGAASGP